MYVTLKILDQHQQRELTFTHISFMLRTDFEKFFFLTKYIPPAFLKRKFVV